MGSLANSIIGEYYADGYVEALVDVKSRKSPSLRVCVRVQDEAGSHAAITQADASLPRLIADIASAEVIASKAAGSQVPSTAFDIWIELDGAASYTFGFLDGEAEDTLVVVRRDRDGGLNLA